MPLVEVHKDGESLRVHPTTVAAHVAVGWRVVVAEPKPTPKAAAKRTTAQNQANLEEVL